MGTEDAARAARDRLAMVGRDGEAEAAHKLNLPADREHARGPYTDCWCFTVEVPDDDVCDQVGADCRDCEEVLYHPHERPPLTEIEAKKILWELGQLAIDSADVGTDLRDRDRLEALMAKAAKRIGQTGHTMQLYRRT